MQTQVDASVHEIRFESYLGPNTLIWFEIFNVAYSPDGKTILRVPTIDQAALDGILPRICDLGLSIPFFRQME